MRACMLLLVGCAGGDGDRSGKEGGAGGAGEAHDDTAAPLDCPGSFARDLLPDTATLEGQAADLLDLPPMRVGDDAYDAWVGTLAARLGAVADVEVSLIDVPQTVQHIDAATLTTTFEGVSTEVPVAAPLHRGGLTGVEGASGSALFLDPEEAVTEAVRGRVVVLDLVFDAVAVDDLRAVRAHAEDARDTLDGQPEYASGAALSRSWMTDGLAARLGAVADAGAVGVVLLTDLSAEEANGLWVRTPWLDLPGVVLADETARRIRDAASAGAGFTAELHVDGARTETTVPAVRGRLLGNGRGVVAMTAASDPWNAVEAGGALAVVAAASGLARWEPGCRPYDLVFDLSPGARSDAAGAADLARDLAEEDVVLAVAVGQAGAVEYWPDGGVAQELVRTGLIELRLAGASDDDALARAVDATETVGLDRTWVLSDGSVRDIGGPLVAAGLPTVELHAGPWTLARAQQDIKAVDATQIRSVAAWLGHLAVTERPRGD